MTEETLKRAINIKKEIDSITDFLRKTLPYSGFTLTSGAGECKYWVSDEETKIMILNIVKNRRDELEKALEEM